MHLSFWSFQFRKWLKKNISLHNKVGHQKPYVLWSEFLGWTLSLLPAWLTDDDGCCITDSSLSAPPESQKVTCQSCYWDLSFMIYVSFQTNNISFALVHMWPDFLYTCCSIHIMTVVNNNDWIWHGDLVISVCILLFEHLLWIWASVFSTNIFSEADAGLVTTCIC